MSLHALYLINNEFFLTPYCLSAFSGAKANTLSQDYYATVFDLKYLE